MDGPVPMMPMPVNTLDTCTMEPNFTDSVATWILATSKTALVNPPMKVTTLTPMTLIAN